MKKIHLKFFVCVVMVSAIVNSMNIPIAVKGDTKQTAAYRQYAQLLEKYPKKNMSEDELWNPQEQEDDGSHLDGFVLCDITGDGVAELFAISIIGARWETIRVFTCQSGKVQLMKMSDGTNAYFDNYHWANGAYTTYVCKKNHIHNVWAGTNPDGDAERQESIYLFKNNRLCPVKSCSSAVKKDVYRSAVNNSLSTRCALLGKSYISKRSATMTVGKQLKLKICGKAVKVQWRSSNSSIATVNANGTVTAKKRGNVTIYAVNGKTKYECKINVKK